MRTILKELFNPLLAHYDTMHYWMLGAVIFMIALMPAGVAYAHTVDAIDNKYRVEIGWLYEPVVSGDTNSIELYVNELTPCPGIEPIECAARQEFHDGITGLEDDLKIQLGYKTDKITLKLVPDHNIDGKYHAFVNPTVSGFYQANLIGAIRDTTVSLSMHPPKVEEREYIEFPEKLGQTEEVLLENQTMLAEDVSDLRNEIAELRSELASGSNSGETLSWVAIALAAAAIAIGAAAIVQSKRTYGTPAQDAPSSSAS